MPHSGTRSTKLLARVTRWGDFSSLTIFGGVILTPSSSILPNLLRIREQKVGCLTKLMTTFILMSSISVCTISPPEKGKLEHFLSGDPWLSRRCKPELQESSGRQGLQPPAGCWERGLLLSAPGAQSQACRGPGGFICLGFTTCLLFKGSEMAYQVKRKQVIRMSD